MTALTKPQLVSERDYLDGELVSGVKHEYLGGVVHAMAGGTNQHSAVATNILGLLYAALRGKPCRPFNSDTKARIVMPDHTRFYYPDAMVVCESNPPSDQFQDRPVVVVEVLSDSARRTDLFEKREAYLTLPSLRVLLLAESEKPEAVVFRRAADGEFGREVYNGPEAVIPLPEISAELPLAEIYPAETSPGSASGE